MHLRPDEPRFATSHVSACHGGGDGVYAKAPRSISSQQGVNWRVLRLRTFGGLTLARGSEDLTGAVTQRRRLALLALLAASGPAGMSRDKLLAYLWPESD